MVNLVFGTLLIAFTAVSFAISQPPERDGRDSGRPGFGFPGFGGPPGMGGPPGTERIEILDKFDLDKNGWLDNKERTSAREFLKSDEAKNLRRPSGPSGAPGGPGGGRGRLGAPGGPGGPRGREMGPAKPGPTINPLDIKPIEANLYDPTVLRTIFLNFENPDWEKELEEFRYTDVDVPAKMIVDGNEYRGVGVRFRGMSSYFTVPAGFKRSLNVSVDLVDSDQRLHGYKTLNLLNGHEDDSMLSSVLYSHIARQYIPAPKVNMIKLVINGESWGLYSNVQQFNKEFLKENFGTTNGARWKVSGAPMGAAGLTFMGNDIEPYKAKYEMKSGNNKDWKALVELCRVLEETAPETLEEELRKIANVDGLLWFLALDNALINCDGYWIRASDFSMYRDDKGLFHFVPHDMNEAFRIPMGPGMGGRGPGGPGGPRPGGPGFGGFGPPDGFTPRNGAPDVPRNTRDEGFRPPFAMMPPVNGVELDPLVGLADPSKPLRSKILSVPSLRKKYIENVKTIADKSMAWDHVGPIIAQFRSLMEKEVELDTKKLCSFEEFLKMTSPEIQSSNQPQSDQEGARRFGRSAMPLREFFDSRRTYLLGYSDETK